jgi:hypothetical protein
MQMELIEHAARVLERADGRSMPADRLYRRISRETGFAVGMAGLLDCLRGAADRFVLLPPPASLLDDAASTHAERSVYTDALAAAGISAAPTIMLAERVADPAPTRPVAPQPGPIAGDATSAALLTELHAALTELLRAAGGDAALARLVSGSLANLDVACRAPEEES